MRPVTLAPGVTTGQFNALLNAVPKQIATAEALTFRLSDGITVLCYTTATETFVVPPVDGSLMQQSYLADQFVISGLKFRVSAGGSKGSSDVSASIEVDEQSVTLAPNFQAASPPTVLGVPFLTAVGRRALDQAVFQRDRWYFDAATFKPLGGIPIFYGYTDNIEALGRTQVTLKVKSDVALLNLMMPRNLYQPNCQYTVYSSGCGANPASFVAHDVVGASPTTSFIPWTSATTQYTLGKIFFMSGPNINQTRSIRKADATGLWLAYPLPYPPIAGDNFAAYPGCDRQYASGCAYFGRQAAFRATPKVPPAVFAV